MAGMACGNKKTHVSYWRLTWLVAALIFSFMNAGESGEMDEVSVIKGFTLTADRAAMPGRLVLTGTDDFSYYQALLVMHGGDLNKAEALFERWEYIYTPGSSAGPEKMPKNQEKMSLDCGGGVMLELVRIQAGTFMMGPAWGERKRMTISKAFYMGVYEVTQAQYTAVMGMNPSHFQDADLPVEYVSWDDAMEFCRRLSSKTGKIVRLPTESEWEYACRAGTTTRYYNGNDPEKLVQVGNVTDAELKKGDEWDQLFVSISASDGYGKTTAPVGKFKPNAWGLYDMHGNVSEWCSDLIEEKSGGTKRAVMGGSWNCLLVNYDPGFGLPCEPGYGHSTMGFRVAVD